MAKAMELLENKENVVIVIFEGNNDKTLLRTKFEKLFKGTKATIRGISGTKSNILEFQVKYVYHQDNLKCSHIPY